ncbi:hypothetical protein JCM10207_003210 [Rhodosporidiobolus poonsookiae]
MPPRPQDAENRYTERLAPLMALLDQLGRPRTLPSQGEAPVTPAARPAASKSSKTDAPPAEAAAGEAGTSSGETGAGGETGAKEENGGGKDGAEGKGETTKTTKVCSADAFRCERSVLSDANLSSSRRPLFLLPPTPA